MKEQDLASSERSNIRWISNSIQPFIPPFWTEHIISVSYSRRYSGAQPEHPAIISNAQCGV